MKAEPCPKGWALSLETSELLVAPLTSYNMRFKQIWYGLLSADGVTGFPPVVQRIKSPGYRPEHPRAW